MLLETARQLIRNGHTVPLIWTCRSEEYYDAKEADYSSFAGEIGADFIDDIAINTDSNVKRISSYGCDLAVSVNWLTILGPSVLRGFPFGVLNAHAGDLPLFRGNACPNWAIIAGESHVGLCIHQMLAELDAGPVLIRDKYSLNNDTYISDVYNWSESCVPAMFVDAVNGLASGKVSAIPQTTDLSKTLRTYPRRPEDGHINWSMPTFAIHRLIRASSKPFSGAYTTLEGQQKMTIWRAEIVEHPGQFLAIPGQICYRMDNDPVIACLDGVIRLTEIDLDGCAGSDEAKNVISRSLRNRLV